LVVHDSLRYFATINYRIAKAPRRSRPSSGPLKQRHRRLIFYCGRRTDVAAAGMTIGGIWPLLLAA
jgi:hypothetical protein